MKNRNAIVIVGSLLFVLANSYAISREFFYVPLLSAVAVVIYLMIWHVDWLMYLTALSVPFSIVMESDKIHLGISLPSEVLMVCLTLLFFFRICYDLSIRRELLRHPVTLAVFAYLVWMLLCCITSEYPLVSIKFLLSKIWFIVSSYFMVIHLMEKDIQKWITFFDCYAFSLMCVVLITTVKYSAYGFQGHIAHWIMKPFYNDHTAYGAVLAMFLPIVVGLFFLPGIPKWKRVLYALMAVVFALGLYLSYSRAAWLSVMGAAGIWLVVKLRIKFQWFAAAILLLGGLFFAFSNDILYTMSRNSQDSSGNLAEHLQSISNISTDASNVERLNRWNSAFRMIEERPVMGWGPGCYQFCYSPYQDSRYLTIISTNLGDGGNAHSEYIGPTAETGFVGLATVLALVSLILYYGITTATRARSVTVRRLSLTATLALITYFIHGTMNNFLDTDKLALPYWGLFALIVVLNTCYIDKTDDECRDVPWHVSTAKRDIKKT